MKKQMFGLVLGTLLVSVLLTGTWAWAQEAEAEDSGQEAKSRLYWDELMHYALIGRLDLAQQYGEALLASRPNPVVLLELAESDRYANSYRNLALMQGEAGLRDVVAQILKLTEEGRFLQRTDTKRIATEVKRLSGTTRGRMMAIERLKDSGEWAVPVIIEAMRDPDRSNELAIIRWALPQLGRSAVNPLIMVLQQCQDLHVRLIVVESLGKIGYHSALPYIKQVIEDEKSGSELKSACVTAIQTIDPHEQSRGKSAAQLFEQSALNYYNHLSSLEVPANQDYANVWFWTDAEGLVREEVARGMFDELMTMRSCENAVRLNPKLASAISLWLSAFFRMEAEGYDQPEYFGPAHADAGTYALTAGPEYLHRVLARALKNVNRPVALDAIMALKRNAGQQSLLYEVQSQQPLIKALIFPDREVRFSAALAIAGALGEKPFAQSEQVVAILAEALRQKGQRYAIVVDSNQQRRNRLAAEMGQTGEFTEVIANEHLAVALEQAKILPSFDLVVLSSEIVQPNINEALDIMQKDYRLAFCPTVVLCEVNKLTKIKKLQDRYAFVKVILEQANAEDVLDAAGDILERNQAWPFEQELADAYAIDAAQVLRNLAITQNKVLNLQKAQAALIDAVREERKAIQTAATQTLARMDSLDAQRAIAALALDEQVELPTRLMALQNLSVSAKAYGNYLLAEQIDKLYQIVSSREIDVRLRNLAAEAYGAFNLPSAKISQLIIEQSVGQIE